MNQLLDNTRFIFISSAFIIATVCCLRWFAGGMDFSYFIVAGTDFVDSTQTLTPVQVNAGQGYDGQAFYRYAIDPLSFEKTKYGITVDLPPYRIQRITYPLLAWMLSLGAPAMIPFWLVAINALAFAGTIFYTQKLVKQFNAEAIMAYLPLLLGGAYMALARDLAEVCELFFFTASVYYALTSRIFLFSLFTTLTIFTRETSIIGLLPACLWLAYQLYQKNEKHYNYLLLLLPYLLFGAWKLFIDINMPPTDMSAGYSKAGLPLKGIIDGFLYNMNFSDTKHIIEFVFWLAFLIWNVWLAILGLKLMKASNPSVRGAAYLLNSIIGSWLVFALIFTLTIYIDDWGFVRILTILNMTVFISFIIHKYRPSALFTGYSLTLALLTAIRVIVRV